MLHGGKGGSGGPGLRFVIHPCQGLLDSRSLSPLPSMESSRDGNFTAHRRTGPTVEWPPAPFVGCEETPGRQSRGQAGCRDTGFGLSVGSGDPRGPRRAPASGPPPPPPPPTPAGAAPRKSGVSAGLAVAAESTTGEGRTGPAGCRSHCGFEGRVWPSQPGSTPPLQGS